MRERNRQAPKDGQNDLGNRPFRTLRNLIKDAAVQPKAQAVTPSRRPLPAESSRPAAVAGPPTDDNGAGTIDDAALFLRAVDDVKQLAPSARQRVAAPPPARPGRPMVSEEAEALAELADLVTGKSPFDVSDSDEYLEGKVKGLDPRIVRRLRRGEFAHQAHLDLHRMTAEQARPAVERFLLDAHRAGRRCVLIIHGRGLNSKDQFPVLKNRLTTWLSRGSWARIVLAFTSARLCDGGAGALYVLLRRERASKKEIDVLNGAKS